MTIYVDPVQGNDRNSGTSADAAWNSLGRANRAFENGEMRGQDGLLLRAGYIYPVRDRVEHLRVRNVFASEDRTFTISRYGNGPDPVLWNTMSGAPTVQTHDTDRGNDHVVLKNLDLFGVVDSGIVWVYGAQGWVFENCRIHGSRINQNNVAAGIAIRRNAQATIKNCIIDDCQGEGIYVGSTSGDWGNNDPASATVINCHFYNCMAEAIDMKPGTKSCLVSHNVITGCAYGGHQAIRVNGTDHRILDNAIFETSSPQNDKMAFGIFVPDGFETVRLEMARNFIRGVYNDGKKRAAGIQIRGNQISVTENDISVVDYGIVAFLDRGNLYHFADNDLRATKADWLLKSD